MRGERVIDVSVARVIANLIAGAAVFVAVLWAFAGLFAWTRGR